jgi:hypothetical protein
MAGFVSAHEGSHTKKPHLGVLFFADISPTLPSIGKILHEIVELRFLNRLIFFFSSECAARFCFKTSPRTLAVASRRVIELSATASFSLYEVDVLLKSLRYCGLINNKMIRFDHQKARWL